MAAFGKKVIGSALIVVISLLVLGACSSAKTVLVCKEVKDFKVVRIMNGLYYNSYMVDYSFADGSYKILGSYYGNEYLARASAQVSFGKTICWNEKVEDTKTK